MWRRSSLCLLCGRQAYVLNLSKADVVSGSQGSVSDNRGARQHTQARSHVLVFYVAPVGQVYFPVEDRCLSATRRVSVGSDRPRRCKQGFRPMTQPPLPYAPEIETPEEDEQTVINGIIEGMTAQSQTVASREHHAARASHAKSTALATGYLDILPDLSPELAQGLFVKPGRYTVAVRFAQGTGETLGDRVSTHRGLSVKIFGVEGEKLDGHVDGTQDFVLASGPTFPSGTAKGFLRDGSVIGKAAGLPEGAKSAVSTAARTFNEILHRFGTESPMADFFGHPFSHPLSEPYFSQAPLRYGAHVAKIAAFPVMHDIEQLREWRLDPAAGENGFRHATGTYFAEHEVRYEIRVQLWNNQDKQPIEDASVEWSVEDAPFQTVAVLILPAQNTYSPARVQYFNEKMTFRPAHSLAVHRPLGSVMRARLQVYAALSRFRHRHNDVPEANPESINEIPA